MIRSLSIAFAALSLSACVSVLPEPEAPDGLYRFGAMTETYPVDAVVAVREPEASRLLGSRVIVSENTAGALRLVRDVEWADNATRLMQVALLDAVNDAGAGVAVAYESGARADYELVWRIEDFSLAGTQARCSLEGTLVEARSRKVVAQTNVASTAAATGSANEARALALAEAGRSCVARIAGFVSEKAVAAEPAGEPE
ncbi:MAG: membrane integrity-associated transporter subunit PqiC [Rhodobacterales bacterium]|nr:membrane integrity-associated transporter subunit PqiC [Rhodobacterales bacterium]